MRMTDLAFSFSASSRMRPTLCSAPSVRTNISTVTGSSRTDGTHRQPAISERPDFTTKTLSLGKPFFRMFSRMMRPMFLFSETPTMPIVSGRRRLRIASHGRASSSRRSRENRQRPSSGTSLPSRMTRGLTSNSSMTNGGSFEKAERLPASPTNRRNASERALGAMTGFRPRNGRATLPKNARGSRSDRIRSSSKRWTEKSKTAVPSRILSFMYSTSSPPPPMVITGPNSRESRTPTRSSEPKPTSS